MITEYTDLDFLHNPKGLPTLDNVEKAIQQISKEYAGRPSPTPLNRAKALLYQELLALEFYMKHDRKDYAFSALMNVRNAHAAVIQIEEIMTQTK